MQLTSSYRQIWKLSYPLMLSGIAQNIINVINTAFLGRVSETALAASALSGVFYVALVMIAYAFGTGTQIIIARKAGARQYSEIGHLVDHSFFISGFMSIFLFLLLEFTAPLFLRLVISSKEIYASSLDYLYYRSYGIPFSLFAASFRSFYTGIARTTVITTSIVIMSVVNVLLDYGLIFGNLGLPPMGIRGAGLASTISEGCAVAFYLWYTLKDTSLAELSLFRFARLSRDTIRQIITISSPIVFQNAISLGAWFMFFIVIEKTGERNLAISNILRSFYMLLMTPIWGYAAAAPTMISNLIGQEKAREVMPVIRRIITVSIFTSLVIVMGNIVSPRYLLSFFTTDTALIEGAIGSLNVLSISLVLFSASIVLLSSVSGSGDTRTSLLIETSSIVLYLLYLFYVAILHKYSLEIIWAAEFVYWTLIGGLACLRLRARRWEGVGTIKEH